MHIKIKRIIEQPERWEDESHAYTKDNASEEEFIVPINLVSLSKTIVTNTGLGQYSRTKYQAQIPFVGFYDIKKSVRTVLISEEEYRRIEQLLSFNNKKELEIISNSYPEFNVRQAIQDLQVNEE